MAIDFPNSPTTNQDYTVNTTTWTYDGAKWVLKTYNSLHAVPVTAMMLWASTTYPTGWLLADGSAISRTTYADLFAAIGTTYGVGDGSTTFNLPSMTSAGSGSPNTIIKVTNSGALEPSAISHAANHTQGGSDVVSVTLNQVPSFQTYRNLIINGTGAVAQRNSGSVSLTTSFAYGSVDRWAAAQVTTAAATTQQITTSLPTGFRYGLRIGRNSGSTSTNIIYLAQALETNDSICMQGKSFTVSFYAKAGANFSPANLGVVVNTGTGTDQAVAIIGAWTGNASTGFSTTLSSSWVRYSFTGTIPSNATQLAMYFSYTPVGTAGADDNVYITGVQLEAGSTATPFEFEPFETTLRKCQRYYEKSYNVDVVPGTNTTTGLYVSSVSSAAYTGYLAGHVSFKVPKRSSTLALQSYDSINGAVGKVTRENYGAAQTSVNLAADFVSETGFRVLNTGAAGNGLGFHWTASAEL